MEVFDSKPGEVVANPPSFVGAANEEGWLEPAEPAASKDHVRIAR